MRLEHRLIVEPLGDSWRYLIAVRPAEPRRSGAGGCSSPDGDRVRFKPVGPTARLGEAGDHEPGQHRVEPRYGRAIGARCMQGAPSRDIPMN